MMSSTRRFYRNTTITTKNRNNSNNRNSNSSSSKQLYLRQASYANSRGRAIVERCSRRSYCCYFFYCSFDSFIYLFVTSRPDRSVVVSGVID